MAVKRRNLVASIVQATGQARAMRVPAIIVAVFCILFMTPQTRAESQSPLPGFSTAVPDKPVSPDDFRKGLKQDKEKGQPQKGGTLPGDGTIGILDVPVGTILDSEIDELARGLRYDPGLMYSFVHDHVQFHPMWGDVKGAGMTLMDRSGNGFDQASLTIALLTEAVGAPGAPHTITNIRYVVGEIELSANQTTNWLGIPNNGYVAADVLTRAGIPEMVYMNPDETIAYTRMEHAWVKATIDGVVYEFDPSFKTHVLKSGLSEAQLATAMGYNRSTFLTSAQQGATVGSDYLKDLNRTNINSNLTTYSTNLANYIKTNYPAGDLADIIGGKTIVPGPENDLPPALPYTVISRDAEFALGSMPSSYRTTLRIQHLGIDQTRNSSEIYGRRLVIKYNASNQPMLLLDGTQLGPLGTAAQLGSSQDIILSINHPYAANGYTYCDQSLQTKIAVGGTWHIVNGWANVGTHILERHRKLLEQNRHDGYADSSDEVLGESFTLVGLTWLAEICRTQSLVGQLSDCSIVNQHCVGIMGQYNAPYIDMPVCLVTESSHNRSTTDSWAAFLAIGGQGSAHEYGVIHQLQDYPALSTVKLLTLANDRTTYDKIFQVTSSNWASVQTQLSGYDAGEISQVNGYVTSGYTVFLPQYGDLGEDAWNGIGFMATKTSEAGYIISGKYNGGYLGLLQTYDIQRGFSNAAVDPTDQVQFSNQASTEPIDLVTGAYTYNHLDLGVGNGEFPFGLQFGSQYNSGRRLEDGPLGLGWNHSLDITTKVASDSFQATGDDSPIDAVANIVALYTTFDLFRVPGLVNNVVCSIGEKWLMDQMIDNVVIVKQGHEATQFVKLPNGSFNAPPGKALTLITEGDNTLLLKDTNGNFMDFDANNRIVRWSDPHGNVVDFTYTSDKLSTVVGKVGGSATSRSLTFTYNGNHVSGVTDSAGRSISFGYDATGNLTSYTDPATKVTTFEYDTSNHGRLTKLYYPRNPTQAYVTNVYDTLGRVKQQTNAASYTYDYYYAYYRTEEQEPSQTPPSGPDARYSTVYSFDDNGRTVAAKDQLGRRTTTEYDGQQRPKKVTSPSGNYVKYVYDINHNVTQTTRVAVAGSGDPNIVESFVYDNPLHQSSVGRLFTSLKQHTDAAGNITTCTYDYDNIGLYGTDVGNLRRVTYPQVPIPGGGNAIPTVDLTYNTYGQKLTETNPEGIITTYEYFTAAEGAGLKKTIADQGGTGHLNLTAELTYDTAGNVLTTKDPRNNITQNQYDARRLVTKTIAPAPFNYETTFDYYADGLLQQVRRLPRSEDDPTQTADLVGTNHGIVTGSPKWAKGIAGLALESDAHGSHVVVPDADALTPASTLTISFWAYWKGSGCIGVSKYARGAGSRAYYLQVRDDGKVEGAIFAEALSYDTLVSTSVISANAWHHIALVFNAGSATIYTDGTANGTKTMCVQSIMNDTQPLILGGSYSGADNPSFSRRLAGLIDEVCIFNRALTQTEVDGTLKANGLKGISALAGFTQPNYPVAYWNLDDEPVTSTTFYTYTPTGQKSTTTGPMDDTVAHDSIKNNHGAVKGPLVWNTGKVGTGISCSSTGGYVTIPDADALTPSTTMSISFWVKFAGTQSTGIYKYTAPGFPRSYYVQVNGSDNKIKFGAVSPTGTGDTLTSTVGIALNQWRHIVVTFNAGVATIYINGTAYGTKTMTVTSLWNDPQPLIIGGYWGLLTGTFNARLNGSFDEVCLFNRVLGPTEVTQLYTNGNTGVSALAGFTTPNYPVGYWNFDEAQVNYTQYAYDTLDRPWKVTDARGEITETRYYPDGQVWRVTDAMARNTITNTYNTDGTLYSVADAKTNTTTYTYDGHIRPKRTNYPNSTYAELTYDSYGRLQTKRNRAAQNIGFTYDALNRIRTKTLPSPSKTITYEYDRVGRLVNSIDTVAGTFHNTYDNAGRLLSTTYPDTKVVSYEYDAAGNRTKLTYPYNNYYVTYAYDELNRLQTITSPYSTVLARYVYDKLSRRRAIVYENLTGSHYLYDGSDRLLSIETKLTTEQFRYAYTYDNVSMRRSMTVNDTDVHAYSYDDTYWLTGADYPTGFFTADTTFNYDNAGNRSSVVSGGTTNYTTNNLNQYSAVGGTTYNYDNNGNLTSDGTNTYTYDAENRLLTVSGAASVTYTYGPDGLRLTKTAGGTTTYYYHDSSGQIIAEASGGICGNKFVFGPGANEPVCVVQFPLWTREYYYYDGLGSVVAIAHAATNADEKYVYNAYGQCQATGTNMGNPYRFTGQRLDAETGLYFYHARFYNAAIGRFLQTDPVGYGDGINWYLYCGNNPIALVDPSGLCGGSWVSRAWDSARNWVFNTGDTGSGQGQRVVVRTIPGPDGQPVPIWADAPSGGNVSIGSRTDNASSGTAEVLGEVYAETYLNLLSIVATEGAASEIGILMRGRSAYRYVGVKEAAEAFTNRLVPNVTEKGLGKYVYYTTEKFTSASVAEDALKIGTPAYRIEVDASKAVWNYEGTVVGRRTREMVTRQELPVLSVTPLEP